MFNEIHQQNLADMIKAHILKFPGSLRQSTMIDLQRFEGMPWYPQVFEKAVSEFGGGFTVNRNSIDIDNPIGVIPAVLARYLELVDEGLAPAQYGTKEAMHYVASKLTKAGHKITIWGVKKNIDDGKIPSTLIGKTRVFLQSALDQYVTDYIASPPVRGPKGPHKKKSETSF